MKAFLAKRYFILILSLLLIITLVVAYTFIATEKSSKKTETSVKKAADKSSKKTETSVKKAADKSSKKTETQKDSKPPLTEKYQMLLESKPGHIKRNKEIFIIDSDGSNRTKLADGFSSRLSYDGKRIAFISDRTGKNEVWIMDRKGGNHKQVTMFPEGWEAWLGRLKWSHDDTKIAVGGWHIRDRAEPGGRHIAVWIAEADGSRLSQIEPSEQSVFRLHEDFDWTADGRITVVDSSGRLVISDNDGSNSQRIVDSPQVREFAYSRDGSKIAFSHDGNTEKGIYMGAFDGIRISNLVEIRGMSPGPGGAHATQLLWSPDGQRVLFQWTSEWHEFEPHEIIVADAKSGSVQYTISNPNWAEQPVPSRDWTRISFTTLFNPDLNPATTRRYAWTANIDGSNQKQLTTIPEDVVSDWY